MDCLKFILENSYMTKILTHERQIRFCLHQIYQLSFKNQCKEYDDLCYINTTMEITVISAYGF